MATRRVEELLSAIAALAPADRQRLVAELTKDAKRPGAGGRKPLRERAPAAVKLAERLDRRGFSLRRIAAALAVAGYVNERGHTYGAPSIRAMLKGPQKRKRPR